MNEFNRSALHNLERRFTNEKKPIPDGMRQAVERAQKVETHVERMNALRRVFGPDINTYITKDSLPGENIILGLFDHVFDQGTNRDTTCHVKLPDGSVRIISEPAVPIHSRSSFITSVQHDIAQNKSVTIGMIDLARFRDADFENVHAPPNTVRSADVVANKAARAIRTALKNVWEELGLNFQTDSYEVGRYGGDEFVIALSGDQATKVRSDIMHKIQHTIESERGFYRDNDGHIQLENVKLKRINKQGDVVEWISPPNKDNYAVRSIFLDYLSRGLLLNEAELTRVVNKYQLHGQIDLDLYKKDYTKAQSNEVIYPLEVDSIDKKIAHISAEHPEFEVYFKYIDTLQKDTTLRTQQKKYLLSIIENSIFDRLLGDFIYSRTHFAEHIKRGEIDRMYIIDLKYLKEINGDMTYADADNELKKLWEEIKFSIPQNERNKIIVSRFAGAFYIGVKKGTAINDEKLKTITSHTLFQNKHAITVPLGFAKKRVRPHERKNVYSILNSFEDTSDKTFYSRLFDDISEEVGKNPSFLNLMATVDIQKLETRRYKPLQKHELYSHLLRGKRSEARLNKLTTAFEEEKTKRLQFIIMNSLQQLSFMHTTANKSILQKTNIVTQKIARVNEIYQEIINLVRRPYESNLLHK